MLSPREIEIIIDELAPHDPTMIGLFGSFARNEEMATSDIDILYTFKNPITLFTLAGLKISLGEKLKRKVDLVSVGALHPRLKKYILQDLVIFYEKAA